MILKIINIYCAEKAKYQRLLLNIFYKGDTIDDKAIFASNLIKGG